MERVVKQFEPWQAADKADLDYYTQLSGNERLQSLLELILPEFLIVAAYAMALHGRLGSARVTIWLQFDMRW